MSKTPCANVLLHHSAYYRKHVFKAGFEANGYKIIEDHHYVPKAHDVLLIWNRSKNREHIAKRYEAAGATIFVTENGYLGNTKAMAIGHHSGAGIWYQGEKDRWEGLQIELCPWSEGGNHILVLPQRSIGEEGVAMPRGWENRIVDQLKKITTRPIRVRKHPGKSQEGPTLATDLTDAWCAVTWASGAGIKAIIAGVPVFHQLEHWIGAPAASTTLDIENPWRGDRLPMLRRLAWAQWTWDEIRSGEAIRYLLKAKE